ncbi:MAG: hypothetical protein IIY43_13830, partial [Oscillospiraceae bacterium]|nr:hypothetical protein [Oscillospiraceae bacterium]
MNLTGLPVLDPSLVKSDHGFVFDAHNHDRKQLITRYRGTVVERTEQGFAVTGWQKSIYHFGGLNREVPILVSMELDETGLIRTLKIDERSRGSQGRRCDFSCLEKLCGEKLTGTPLAELGSRVSSAPDVKCLHLFEILSACASFFGTLAARGLTEGNEQEYIAILPERNGLRSDSTHEILGQRDQTQVRLEYRTAPRLNGENLAESLDAAVTVQYNGKETLTEELHASDFESVYAQLNRLFSKCHHREKAFFGLKGRVRFFNSPSMVGLF